MKLVVFSHKKVWKDENSPSGFSTDGGFAFQMEAISKLFNSTSIVVPCIENKNTGGQVPLKGNNFKIIPIDDVKGSGLGRKLKLMLWFTANVKRFWKIVKQADAVHAPIPGDIGTLGMLIAKMQNKPLFIRYCGNWENKRTQAEKFWLWFMEKYAGGKTAVLATGGSEKPPSSKNKNINWIFSTSVSVSELEELMQNAPAFNITNPRLIIVCRQEKEKGTEKVIEALPLLINKYPQIVLDVVGDGGYISKLKQKTTELKLENHVVFHGKVGHQQVLELLQKANIFTYPTRSSEGFPKVILEAMASGLPIITTPVSVLPQLIKKGCGILIEKEDPQTIANAIDKMLSNEKLYYEFQNNSINTAKNLTLEAWGEAICNHLQDSWQLKLSEA